MKCHVPGANVKGRTIHVLARFGDELFLESLPDGVHLKTLNSSECAYALIKFNKNFFSYFNYNFYSTENIEGLKCKISMKSALNAFKSPTHMDKQVENLEIKLDPDSSKLTFELKCKHGIVKTHCVSILDSKVMRSVYTKDLVPNRITSSQRLMSEALGNFQSSDDQMTMEATEQLLILRNYVEANTDLTKVIRTQISLKSSEFDSYTVGAETTITFTLKEFKALLAFAESLSLPLQLYFETTGKPAVFIVHNGTTFEARFVLATSKPDSATQATTQNSSRTDKRKGVNNSIGSAKKKPHLECQVDLSCLDEDSHLFNYIDIPEEHTKSNANVNGDNGKKDDNEILENMDCDIPGSPTSRIMKSVFKKCFESTFDPRAVQRVILAENSDSD